jgi:hypothetical protein
MYDARPPNGMHATNLPKGGKAILKAGATVHYVYYLMSHD